MKVFYSAPKHEIRIVKPDRNRQEYEFWVLIPKRVGGARKEGVQDIRAESGHRFVNLNEACAEAASLHGFTELAEEVRTEDKHIKLRGLDLVEQGRWVSFCKLRKLDPRDIEAMQREYKISANEIAAMGKQ